MPLSGRSYLKQKDVIMNNPSNAQQYCRYRDATQSYSSKKNSASPGQYVPNYSYLQATKRSENEYSRYRDSSSLREKTGYRTSIPIKNHYKCRSSVYDRVAQRFPVPDEKVPWHVDFPDYEPVEYTTEKVQHNPKADPCDPWKVNKYNQIDNKIDRRSFTGIYFVDPKTNRPRNPLGRTGMTGRGRLYHWGPNHAGDPVVTRWKRDANAAIVYHLKDVQDRPKPVLEFVAIRRRDTGQWALPGGMVDPGESVSQTVVREFQEEAARGGLDDNLIERLFTNGYKLYESYVDDPRNTDNAWMETVAMHFHDDTGHLTEGDDADKVVWCTVDQTLQLYASHKEFLRVAVERCGAFW